jgi:serine/threonine protein phosphatase PrpC
MRQGNEDSYLIHNGLQLFAVADGMGGHRAGEVASHAALGALRDVLYNDPNLSLTEAVGLANDAVYQMAVADPSLQGMGTTLTAVRMDGGAARLGHVGDSRAYLLRDDQLLRITEDHSFVDQLRREGRITEEQAATHPQRSILTRALGIEPGVPVDPGQVDLLDGDRLLLCSDGLHALVRDPVIHDILRREAQPQAAAEALVAAANAAGGDDNITAVVIDVHDDDGEAHERAVVASAAVEPTAESPGAATVDLPPVEMLPVVGPELDLGAPTGAARGDGAPETAPDAAEAEAAGAEAAGADASADGAALAAAGSAGTTTVDIEEPTDVPPPGSRGAIAPEPAPDGPRRRRRSSRRWLIPVVVVAATAGAIIAAVVATGDDEGSPGKPALTSASAPTPSSGGTTTRRPSATTTTLATATTATAVTTASPAATTATTTASPGATTATTTSTTLTRTAGGG